VWRSLSVAKREDKATYNGSKLGRTRSDAENSPNYHQRVVRKEKRQDDGFTRAKVLAQHVTDSAAIKIQTDPLPRLSITHALPFVRVHRTLRCTPAMAAAVADRLWSLEELSRLYWSPFDEANLSTAASGQACSRRNDAVLDLPRSSHVASCRRHLKPIAECSGLMKSDEKRTLDYSEKRDSNAVRSN